MPKASLVVLFLALLLVGAPAGAQDANETVTNETPDAPATNETPGEAVNETDAPPAAPEPVSLVLEGHQVGSEFVFRLEGQSQNNPRLTFAPGAEVTVTLRTVSGAIHNFCTEAPGEKVCTKLVSEGEEDVITFTAPESGTFEYWCDPHRGSGMRGQIVIGAADGGAGDGGEQEEFAGETVDLGDLGYPDCAGTKIPAASAEKAVGGPTVADYVAKCRSGTSDVAQGRPAHPVDYIIPGSIALIGLGIVGVLWVSRRYRP